MATNEEWIKLRDARSPESIRQLVAESNIWNAYPISRTRDGVSIKTGDHTHVEISPGLIRWSNAGHEVETLVLQTVLLLIPEGATVKVRGDRRLRRALQQAGYTVINDNPTARAARFLFGRAQPQSTRRRRQPDPSPSI